MRCSHQEPSSDGLCLDCFALSLVRWATGGGLEMTNELLEEMADLASVIASDARTIELDAKGIGELERAARRVRDSAEKLEEVAERWAAEAR